MRFPFLILILSFLPVLGLAQSTNAKAWTSWKNGNANKAATQAEKLLSREEDNALARCVMGHVRLEMNDDPQEALRQGLWAQASWRNVVTSEQRAAWKASGFGIAAIQDLIEAASQRWAAKVMKTPSTQDDLSLLEHSEGMSQEVLMEVRLHLERAEFERAKDTGTRDAFQEFMDAFPMSSWNQDALTAIQALDFEEAERENSLEAWRTFVRKHPAAALVDDAMRHMDRMVFERARQSHDANELTGYLNEFPEGAFVKEATLKRDSLEWQQALQDSSLTLMRAFVNARAASHLASAALDTLGARVWASAGPQMDLQALASFVREFATVPEAELAAMALHASCAARNQVAPLQLILDWDDQLDSLDVLGSLMAISCRYGRAPDYLAFARDHEWALDSRPALSEALSQATDDARSLLSESEKLLGANEEFLRGLHARSYATFLSLQEALSPEGRDAMTRSLEGLMKQGLENPWVTAFVENSNKEFQASERRLTDAVNSKELELVPVISADNRELLFCRHFEEGGEDIYRSMRAQGRWSQAKSVEELNTFFGNEAPLNISSDGTELIGFVTGEISKSVRGLAGWEAFEPMPELNIGGWNADAQLVSTKEAYLFASRDDYTDNVDLYVAEVDRNGRILTPELLGPTINTPYAERTPFLHPDMKTLYFSSEGHGGYGGLDVFMSRRLADTCWNCWSEPVNLGWAINSIAREWGFKISTDGKMAYYSKDGDIHTLELPEEVRPELVATVEGTLVDRYDQAASADIVWEDLETGSAVGRASTDPVTGRYFIVLPTGKIYGYFVVAEGYFGTSSSLDLRNQTQFEVVQEDIELVYLEDALDAEKDLTIRINNLFFEYGSDKLTPLSNAELLRVATLLLESQRKVKLTGHTDNIGGEAYNLELSKKRASSVKQAFIELNVPSELLEVDGAGESMPVASNDTEQGRKKNRRVELEFTGE